MDIIYKIVKHFSDNWKDYLTAGSITGFLLLSAIAGNYDGRKIEDKPKIDNKRNLNKLLD